MQSHSYKKIISRLESFDQLPSEDKTNLTCIDRCVADYDSFLRIDLSELILSKAKKQGRKINILDAGCGKGVVLSELLSSDDLNGAINTCTGVSVSYFDGIKKIKEQHEDRFIYYKGKVQDFLLEQKNQYDIIIDVWGAFSYSSDKLELFKLYYQALTLNGEAVVLSPNRSTLTIKSKSGDMRLSDYCNQYREIFVYKREASYQNPVVTIIKNNMDVSFSNINKTNSSLSCQKA